MAERFRSCPRDLAIDCGNDCVGLDDCGVSLEDAMGAETKVISLQQLLSRVDKGRESHMVLTANGETPLSEIVACTSMVFGNDYTE